MSVLRKWFFEVAVECGQTLDAETIASFLADKCVAEGISDKSDLGVFVGPRDAPKASMLNTVLGDDCSPEAKRVFVEAAIRGRRQMNSTAFAAARSHSQHDTHVEVENMPPSKTAAHEPGSCNVPSNVASAVQVGGGARRRRREEDEPDNRLERAAALLLRKRGYTVVAPESGDPHTAVHDSTRKLQATTASLSRIVEWVDQGPAIAAGGSVATLASATLRPELCAALLPLLLHLFFCLCDCGELAIAQQTLTDCASKLLRGAGYVASATTRTIERLRLIHAVADLKGDEAFERFRRQECTVVAMCPLARELLSARLLTPESVALADMFHCCTRVVDSTSEKALATGGGGIPEDVARETAKINKSELIYAVDFTDPPVAYGECWERIEDLGDSSVPSFSASTIRKCGVPLPPANSRSRRKASQTFSAQAAVREDLGSGKMLPTVAAYIIDGTGDGDVNSCSISVDGHFCATGSHSVRLWDVASVRHGNVHRQNNQDALGLPLIGHKGRVLSVCFSPDAELLLSAGQDGTVRLWNVEHKCGLCVFSHSERGGRSGPVWAVDWCVGGHYFFTGAAHSECFVWSVESATPLRVLAAPEVVCARGMAMWPDVETIRAHPSARYVATATSDSVALWDIATASPVRLFRGIHDARSLAFSACGGFLAAGLADGEIRLFDVGSTKLLSKNVGNHQGPVLAMDFSWPSAAAPQDAVLFSGGEDGLMQVCSLASSSDRASLSQKPLLKLQVPVHGSQRPPAIVAGRFTPSNTLIVAAVEGRDSPIGISQAPALQQGQAVPHPGTEGETAT